MTIQTNLMSSFMNAYPAENERGDRLESDFFAQSFIAKRFQEFDLGLYQTKWFDYRHMTPLEATWSYVAAYGEIYRATYARVFDERAAEHVKPLTVEKIREGLVTQPTKTKRIFTGCWRGRQFADALGMPYEDYLELAFTYRLGCWNRRYMPQPEHLYHPIDLEKIQNRWEEIQGSRLCLATHHAYMVQNYCGTPAQNDYHEWLFKQAGIRANPPAILARLVNEDHMPVEKVRSRLEEWQLEVFERCLAQT